MKTMFLTEEQKKALNKGLRECPKEARAEIREYIDMLCLEWAMIQNVFDGHAVIVGRDEEDRSLLFKMTRAGARYVEEELLHLNDEEKAE